MVISAALRPGCSNSVSRVFEESDPNDVGGPGRNAFDADALVLLGAFEVDTIPWGEAFE